MANDDTSVSLVLGNDLQLVFEILNGARTTALDITGWTLSWKLKRNLTDPDSKVLIAKSTSDGIVIAGVFNATPASNLQRATVTLAASDSRALTAGVCHHELKRIDTGFNTVLVPPSTPPDGERAPLAIMLLIRGVHRA